MNRFVISNGLPYLLADGRIYAVRWDDKGFTVGAEVKLASVPAVTYAELSILAQCAGHLDSIGAVEDKPKPKAPVSTTKRQTATASTKKKAAKG